MRGGWRHLTLDSEPEEERWRRLAEALAWTWCPVTGYHGSEDPANGNGAGDVSMQNCFLEMGFQGGLMGRKAWTFFIAFGWLGAITPFLLKISCGCVITRKTTLVPLAS